MIKKLPLAICSICCKEIWGWAIETDARRPSFFLENNNFSMILSAFVAFSFLWALSSISAFFRISNSPVSSGSTSMISSGSSWSASGVSLSSLFSVSVSSFLASESLESSLIGSSSSSNSKTSLALDFLDSLLDFLDWLDLKSALDFSYSLQTFLSNP